MRVSLACLLVHSVMALIPAHGAITGHDGINSDDLELDGSGVFIGQVENGRAARAGYDADTLAASNVNPHTVLGTTGAVSPPNSLLDGTEHATLVAGVMIGGDVELEGGAISSIFRGVSPQASLISAAFQAGDDGVQRAMNAVATRESGRVRATNLSFGGPISFLDDLDGNTPVTQFLDWSAGAHDILYVAAWPNNSSPVPAAPSDNFNGITVAGSGAVEGRSPYRRFADANQAVTTSSDAKGTRTSIELSLQILACS